MSTSFGSGKVGPVGVCIYCGETNSAVLTDEHIIPRSLNGTIVLLKASCLQCNKYTHAFEGHVTGQMLGDMRLSQGMKSRRQSKKLKTISVWAEYEDRCTSIEIPKDDYFGVFPTLVFNQLPSILDGRAEATMNVTVSAARFEGATRAKYPGVLSWHGKGTFNPHKFALMLAKIAHSFACERLGLEGFEPLLPPFILSDGSGIFSVVGGNPYPVKVTSNPVHRMGIRTEKFNTETYLVSTIELFANWNFPSYFVAVGRENALTQERLAKAPFYKEAASRKSG